jgi:hypothetical protein
VTVAFRSSANVVNGTAGTSVVVGLPGGALTTDVCVAYIAQAGNGSVTPPAGWTLIGSQAATTTVTVTAYWRTGLGGSSTFTLGASVRNWGWIGAYTGVDPVSPIGSFAGTPFTSAGTSFPAPTLTGNHYGRGVFAAAGVRTATGAATTWTEFGVERFDGSTNAGAGTDIAGATSDSGGTLLGEVLTSSETFTASQSQSSGVSFAVFLAPYFTPFDPAVGLATKIELALGADPDADPAGWTWTDVSQYVKAPAVTITKGRADWQGQATPTQITFALDNTDGRFTPGNPFSPYWPNIVRNLPVRVSVPVGFAPPTERGVAFVRSWQTTFDGSPTNAVVAVVAKGRLARLQRQRAILRSPLFRSISGTARAGTAVRPYVYWPCEDGSGSTSAASAIAGVDPMAAVAVTFAAESTLVASAPLPTMSSSGAGAAFNGKIPPYAATGQWCAVFVMKIPTAPAVATFPVAVVSNGTAPLWAVAITPGAPGTVGIRAYNSAGTQILADDVNLDPTFYGNWFVYSIGVTQSGPDINYVQWTLNETAGSGSSGTLAGRTHGNATAIRAAANTWTAGSGIGHFAVFTDPAFDTTNDPIWISQSLGGNAGEEPRFRFQRLCIEEGIDYDFDQAFVAGVLETSIGMGPQPIGPLTDQLQQCQDVDMGLIHDGGPGGELYFNTRSHRYNQTPALTMNNALQQVPKDITPTFDDQAIINDFTTSRTGGSSARYADAANNLAEGAYPDGTALNLGDDTHLYEISGWRVNLGITPGQRYPQLPVDLMASPELAQQWLACAIGSRVQDTNLPGQYGTADVIIEGYTEVLGRYTWSPMLNCSPARPYDVFVLDGSRLDTAGSTLTAGVSAGATSLSVATSTGPLWTTGAVAFDIEVSGIRVSVTNVSGAASPQTFTVTGSTVTKALPINSAVRLWRSSVLAL